MDNICHSLAGAAIAQAGFARRFPRATLLCVIGANIPDVDALTYVWADSLTALQFRRGWTHGLLALSLWTLLLTASFWWWHRRSTARLTGTEANPLGAILLASLLSVWSHTSLDWLNNYGVRWLMPFSDRWFYGDSLFIVDPILLLFFGVGWWLSRRRIARGVPHPERPARFAVALALLYILGMRGVSDATRAAAAQAVGMVDANARQLMVAPGPASLLRRQVLVRTDSTYDWYESQISGLSIHIGPRRSSVAIGGNDPRAVAAARSPQGMEFLRWSRFPYFVSEGGGDGGSVFIGDARYTEGTNDSWASTRVTLK